YSTVGTVLSVCDSLNYLLEEKELLQVFRLVNNYLYPGGLFLFDFNTVYKYSQVIGDAVIAENREDCSFIWENYYHEQEEINEYDLTVFVQEEGEHFRRFVENHLQRGYTPQTMCGLVEQAGMQVIRLLDADTLGEVTDQSQRVYVLAREQGKPSGNMPVL
ncbi:MAG: class I SAM-dependent methyltransferase, partial [Acetatifactor sp.]|nr:class I SAM-dependent methyltransferase [Acetatifactor sp.]